MSDERRRGDEALRVLIDGEYRRNVLTLASGRLIGTAIWLGLVVLLPILFPVAFAGIGNARPWVAAHFVYAIVLALGLRQGSEAFAVFHRATQACPDVTFVFLSQIAIVQQTRYPSATAAFTLSIFLAIFLMQPAGARRYPTFAAAALSALFQSALFWGAYMRDWMWPVLSFVVLFWSAITGVHFAERFRHIAIDYARLKSGGSPVAAAPTPSTDQTAPTQT